MAEEQANDKYKRILAIENGILEDKYHEIDCRYSTLEWCRPNIEKVLSQYTDLSDITNDDWKQLDIKAQRSLKIEVCKYWRDNKEINNELTTQQVVEALGVSIKTVRRYLKWGSDNGICIYDAKAEKEAKDKRLSTFAYIIKPNGDKWFDEAMSMKEMGKVTGIGNTTIRSNLDKGVLEPHRNSKYDPKYIGSRIVSAEVYDNQTQAS